ncbi:MAG: thioredoxin domain-containing protein [Blastopirellula sp.]|nr:MAG: thioredoxin domain-containing protein [Blastopirellula sp.]
MKQHVVPQITFISCWNRLFTSLVLAFLIPLFGGVSCSVAEDTQAAPPKGNSTVAETDNAADGDQEETKHASGKKHSNHLTGETSPYLLMHAHNPVNWYPWGEEAFAKAKKENKPIFLSVGYSSCHWCHVMEVESFTDEEIAAFLNENFVCIKVDREERPDVDSIYMTAVQLITRSGGWPMSVFMTPEAKPFFGGTYWPARDGDRGPTTGFETVISHVDQLWKENEADLRSSADQLTGFIQQTMASQPALKPLELNESVLVALDENFATDFDPEHGGFRFDVQNPRIPKFPEPSNLLYLLTRAKAGNEKAKTMVLKTIDEMADGGIRDHLGGGFHRYSVDRFWSIPHFEKMLYDNGQLASVYAEAYQLTNDEKYKVITEELLDFVLRELTGPGGEFYSALDADSEGEEGKFYRYEKEELEELLTPAEFALAEAVYGLGGETLNFEEEYYATELQGVPAEIAKALKIEPAEFAKQLSSVKQKLLEHREKRVRPLLDTKVLTAWNGLMIRGFADSGRIFKAPKYTAAAAKAADFMLKNLRTEEGRLYRTYGGTKAKLNGYIDDYAFLIEGLLALHQATNEQKWLDEAEALMAKQIEFFGDEKNGGFFFTSNDHEILIARGKDSSDGALPSGNTISAANLYYLSQQTGKPEYKTLLDKTIQSNARLLELSPQGVPRLCEVIHNLLAANQVESESKGEDKKSE